MILINIKEEIIKKTKVYIKQMIAQRLHMNEEEIEEESLFEGYGIDSLYAIEFRKEFGQYLGKLPATLFFDYPTVSRLADYFIKEHYDKLAEILHFEQIPETEVKEDVRVEEQMPSVMKEVKQIETKPMLSSSLNLNHFSRVEVNPDDIFAEEVFKVAKAAENPLYDSCKEEKKEQDVAIIGISGRYPMAGDVDTFWKNLKEGKNCITEIPDDRWNYRDYYFGSGNPDNIICTKWGGFIDDMDKFDSLFFHIAPSEAEKMDPQERIFMETVWSAIEDAGIPEESFQPGNHAGMFVGVMNKDYEIYGAERVACGRLADFHSYYWSFANRISYFLNMQGPSMAIDTACSASLAAVHLASESIKSGECEFAVAGGVNLILHPSHMEMLSKSHMLSSKEKSMCFSEEGDGLVIGEGTGAIVLKSLNKAKQEGDHIYGIIKATSMNSCGRISHYMVQNPQTQSALIYNAYKKAGFDPATVSYIEAQATGSHVGDAMEFSSLNHAFSKFTDKRNFCALGSVKSNIGHLESASGIAALTKVILQMKYKQLFPTINAEHINQDIDFHNSCFYLQRDLAEWKRPVSIHDGMEIPRRAGISSFGAGGSDVHVVLEEYIENREAEEKDIRAYVIVVSAKNDECLKQKAKDLLAYIRNHEVDLNAFAYTLQTGRRSMEQRLAFVVENIMDLEKTLKEFILDRSKELYYLGRVKKGVNEKGFIVDGRAGKEFLRILLEDEELERLACLWTTGVNIDWKLLYPGNKPVRITLPSYPFVRKRYWKSIEDKTNWDNNSLQVSNDEKTQPGELVQNISSVKQICFRSRLTKIMDAVKDHCVQGVCIVPMALLLNLILKAGQKAMEQTVRSITDVLLLLPVSVQNSEEKVVTILDKKEDYLSFKLEKESGDLCTQGKIFYLPEVTSKKVEIEELTSKLAGRLTGRACYDLYTKIGFQYGPLYQTLEWVCYSEKEAVAKLHMPQNRSQLFKEFTIHPAILDGMIQSIIGILYANEELEQTYLPFFIGRINILNEVTGTEFYVRTIRTENKDGGQIYYYNIELYLQDGSLALMITDYAGKAMQTESAKALQEVEFLKPVWIERMVSGNSSMVSNPIIFDVKGAFGDFCGLDMTEMDYAETLEQFEKQGKELTKFLYVWGDEDFKDADAKTIEKIVWGFAELIHALQKRKLKQDIQIVYAVKCNQSGSIRCGFEAIAGLARSVMAEDSRFHIKLVLINHGQMADSEVKEIARKELLYSTSQDNLVSYVSGKRYVKEYRIADEGVTGFGSPVFKEKGVYLITGGLGGIGTAITDYIARQTQSVIILVGKSKALDLAKQKELEELGSYKAEVIYECCDCSDKEEVYELVTRIIGCYRHLDGIVHAAGVVDDKLFIRKTEEEFQNTCAPKLMGVINLDEVTKNLKLDFFVCCSSISAIIGNAGQADYAYANYFMDAYMAERRKNQKAGKRYGKSISINWPLWIEGGMKVPDSIRKSVKDATGLDGITNETGLMALCAGIHSDESNLVVVTGDRYKIHEVFHVRQKDGDYNQGIEAEETDMEGTIADIEEKIITICAEILKVEKEELDVEEELDNYGLDSIMMITFMQKLEEDFDEILEPDLLANENTIQKLVAYFYRHGIKGKQDLQPEYKKEAISAGVRDKEAVNDDRIAIIGMSCRFPKSPTLEAYWENLKNGKNMISEITKDRWDIQKYYSDDKNEPNKSYTKYAGLLEDIYGFDTAYFNISEQEADAIDPYHRIMLELSDEVFKRAGYQNKELDGGSIGVYIGSGESNYFNKSFADLSPEFARHIIVNTIPNMMAARISDYYNLKGPSECVDTACSSSLVALHHACQGIQSGDCDMALVGGVELILNEYYHVAFSKAGILTEGKEAYIFDERADGTVLGEGAGLLLLKSYQKAVEDGDLIQAVICGTAVNNDGHTMGLTVPSMEGQKAVIGMAIEKSGISPRNISYLEAHGTGTLLGDPIEIKAASDVYRKYTQDKQFCAVGSVKSNIGHLLRAAGMAGIIKIVLSIQHKKLPPTLNCTKPHPRFQFENSPFYPILKTEDWNTGKEGRYAAVSAFGFGGTNSFVILGEFQQPVNYIRKRKPLKLTEFHRKPYCIDRKKMKYMVMKDCTYTYEEDYVKDHLGENPFEKKTDHPHVLFGVTHFSMAAEAAAEHCMSDEIVHIRNIFLSNPVTLYSGERVKVLICGKKKQDGTIPFISQFDKNGNGEFIKAAEGIIQNVTKKEYSCIPPKRKMEQNSGVIKYENIYSGREALRGDSLKNVQCIYTGSSEAAGELKLTEAMRGDSRRYKIHPALLDAGFIVSVRGIKDRRLHDGRKPGVWIPFMVKDLYLNGTLPEECICQTELVSVKNGIASFNYMFFSNEGEILLELKEFCYKYVYYENKEDDSIRAGSRGENMKVEPTVSHKLEKQSIHDYLKKKIAGYLNQPIKKFDGDTNFMSLGMDSVSLIHLASEIEEDVKIELYPTVFFEYQNINEMTEFLENEYRDAFDEYLTQVWGAKAKEEQAAAAEDRVLQNKQPIIQENDSKLIAVIGMNGRFSGAEDLEQFWQIIRDSKNMITEIPKDHFDYESWYSEDRSLEDRTYSKWGSFIAADTFDPEFFGISPREAIWLDPQLRLLMEVVYGAMEDAGYAGKLKGTNTGVFVGSCLQDYWDEIVRNHYPISDYQGNSSLASNLSGRLSYLFDLHGVSMNVDHACASSLSAIHFACKAIQHGECDVAITAGVNLLLSPLHYINASRAQALSPTGKCHSFDISADGYVPGEGVGALILKPLSKAIADHDQIHAIIRGTATNHNGKSNNPTSPRTELQVKLLLDAWKDADIDPETISYIEAHGTGTMLGDPVEIDALNNAFRKYTNKEHFCAVGTVKSNLGHLEGAAGIAGVIKSILCMKHEVIVRMPEFHQQNPYLKLEHSPVYINTVAQYWETEAGRPRRAGVSAFGLTGNNTHILLEEYPDQIRQENDIKEECKEEVFVLSAKNEERLKCYAKRFLDEMIRREEENVMKTISLRDICYTMAVKREHMEIRFGCIISDINGLKESLSSFLSGRCAGSLYGENTMLVNRLERWLAGEEVVWEEFYDIHACNVISLPSYPFAKGHYWFPKRPSHKQEDIISRSKSDSNKKQKSNVVYLESVWEACPVEEETEQLSRLLIVDGIGGIKAQELKGDALIQFGDCYKKEKNHFFVRNGNEEDYQRVFRSMVEEALAVENIIYIPKTPETMEEGKRSIEELFALLKGMTESTQRELKRFFVTYAYAERLEIATIQALGGYILSLGRVLPKVNAKLIELVIWKGYEEVFSYFQKEANEPDPIVRYENEIRMVNRIRRIELKSIRRKLLRTKGTYLITGGLGGLGITFAKELHRQTLGRLILLGRSKLDCMGEERLQELKNQGMDVVYYSLDVTDLSGLKHVIEKEKADGNPIHGVIHAAGIPSDRSIMLKSKEEFRNVLRPKIDGLIALDQALCKEPLDFFCVFSSNAAVLGDSGQCDYAVANRFMDCFMEQRQKMVNKGERFGTSVAMDWPLWKNGGMHLNEEAEKLYLQSSGMNYLENNDGRRAWLDLLEGDRDRMAVIVAKEETIQKILTKGKDKQSENIKYVEVYSPMVQKPNLYVSHSSRLEQDLIGFVAEVLQMTTEKVKNDVVLGDMGFDSISMKELAEKLSSYYQISISPAVFYTAGSIGKLSVYLKEHYGDKIQAFYAQKSEQEQEQCENFSQSDGVRQVNLNKISKTYEDIAIIGAAGKFPGAADLNEYWKNLIAEKDCITVVPEERWDYRAYYSEEAYAENKTNSKWGGFIEGADKFDAKFFGISNREANLMDPQHRVFLQIVYKAIEDAGYDPSSWSGRSIGVFGGIQFHDYEKILYDAGINQVQTGTGNASAMLCNRISYLLNLKGPSEAIDTACSSSMVAIHKAVKAIQADECEMAIAGGVSLLLTPYTYLIANPSGALSPDGRCHTFDADANGYVKGEGAGAVILKPLRKAVEDGDSIYAVIRGSAENHGGRSNSPTAPNAEAQAEVIKAAYKAAQIKPNTVTYIETHGTGTQLGDPVEIEGLRNAFRMLSQESDYTQSKEAYCGLGSVKTNIGHLEPASGIASLLKVLLSMRYKILPASIHFKKLNPYIQMERSPFYIVNKTKEWNCLTDEAGNSIPRRAGISSFGFGGSNVHMILEEYVQNLHQDHDKQSYVFVFSAKTEDSLKRYVNSFQIYLQENKSESFGNIAYTLSEGREQMDVRIALIASDTDELERKLFAYCQTGKADFKNDEEFVKEDNTNVFDSMLDMVARSFVSGNQEYHRQFAKSTAYTKISLPTYSFEPNRHWVEKTKSEQADESQTDIQELLYLPGWEKAALMKDFQMGCKPDRVIILYPESVELTKDLLVSKFNDQCVPIKEARIEKWDTVDYGNLKKGATEIYFLGGCYKEPKNDNQKLQTLEESQQHGILPLFRLIKKLDTYGLRGSDITIKLLTFNVYDVAETEQISPFDASMYGFLMAVAREYRNWKISLIDCDRTEIYGEEKQEQIINYLLCDHGKVLGKRNVIRNGNVYKMVIRPIFMPEQTQIPFRKHGVYMIFGGAGGIGLELSRYMVQNVSARVVLVGRSRLSEEKKAAMQVLEQYGGQVLYIQADMTNYESVRMAVQKAKERFGSIQGVVHSALVLKDSTVENMDEKSLLAVLDAKVKGTVVLDMIFKEETLDFMLFFSAAQSFYGNAGQSNYAAACMFKDAYSRYIQKHVNYPVKTINWGFWGSIGVVASEDYRTKVGKQGAYSIEPKEGMEVVKQMLNHDYGQILAVKADKKKLYQMLPIKENIGRAEGEIQNIEAAAVGLQDNVEIPKEVRIQDIIVEIIADVLDVNQQEIPIDESYESMGIDSILSIEIIDKLNKSLETRLKPTDLFNFASIKALAGHIRKDFGYLLRREDLKRASQDKEPSGIEKQMGSARQDDKKDKVAIIGMSGRFPDVKDMDDLWQKLKDGFDGVSEITRWKEDETYQAVIPEKMKKRWGAFLKDIDQFDPLFFNISPKEAEQMDPQQRIFLEEAWKAFEDAGYSKKAMEGSKCGVYLGYNGSSYYELMEKNGARADSYAYLGNSEAILAARISYFLNLKGPSITINTACSSSLVAVHLASESILCGTCDMAIAGGVMIMVTPMFYRLADATGMLSQDGKCKAFDQKADGIAPGECVAAVILKRLDKALEDGDHIYAIIEGSEINQDGSTNGITAPSEPSQTELECSVYEKYHINPEKISYIEAHGTGTKLGDPIELDALAESFRRYTDKKRYCAVGSVKTNFGHSLAGAGITGIIKILLCMKHKQLVPSIHCEQENELLNLEDSPFYINKERKEWRPEGGKLRYAAISSFGLSGTNAHIVLREPDEQELGIEDKEHRKSYIIPLSAKNEKVLIQKKEELIEWLIGEGRNHKLRDISFTLCEGRNHFLYRMCFAASSVEELIKKLKEAGREQIVRVERKKNQQSKEQIEQEERVLETIENQEMLCQYYVKGYDLNWTYYFNGEKSRRVSMPTYPFDHKRYWLQKKESGQELQPLIKLKPVSTLGERFEVTFRKEEFYLRDHVIMEKETLPGVVHIGMAKVAGELADSRKISKFSNIVWMKPVMVAENPKKVFIRLKERQKSTEFEIYSKNGQEENVHTQGRYEYVGDVTGKDARKLNLNRIRERCTEQMERDTCYQYFSNSGTQYGVTFQVIQIIHKNSREALAKLVLPQEAKDYGKSIEFHPAILDGAFQSTIGLKEFIMTSKGEVFVPFSITELLIYGPLQNVCYVYVKPSERNRDKGICRFDLFITDEGGNVLIQIREYTMRKMTSVGAKGDIVKDSYMLEALRKLSDGQMSIAEVKQLAGGTGWRMG